MLWLFFLYCIRMVLPFGKISLLKRNNLNAIGCAFLSFMGHLGGIFWMNVVFDRCGACGLRCDPWISRGDSKAETF